MATGVSAISFNRFSIRRIFRSMRVRLFVLALCVILPTIALMSFGAALERQQTITSAHERILELARIGAEQQNDIIQEAENLLRVLARVPNISNASSSDASSFQCHELLQGVTDDHPRIEVITVTNLNGQAICNSQEEQPNYNISDRRYFKELIGPDPPTFALSELLLSKRNGKPTLIAAVPLTDSGSGASVHGVIVASLNLDWFARLAHRLPGSEAHSVMVIDTRDGAVLASSLVNGSFTGQKFPTHPLVQAFRASPSGGVIDTRDFAGFDQIFGFEPLPGTNGHMMVAVGISRTTVLEAANNRFLIELTLVIAVGCGAMLIALQAVRYWFLRPGLIIVDTVRQFGRGMITKRIALKGIAVPAMRVLAQSFNTMAASIEKRDLALSEAHAALETSEEHHRTLAETMTDMITRFDERFDRVYISSACQTLLGYTPSELIGGTLKDITHPDDWPLLEASVVIPLCQGSPHVRASFRGICKNGSQIWLETSGQPLHNAKGFVLVTRDVSERKQFEASLEQANAQLESFAREDALTGLPNRRRFDEAFETEWNRACRNAEPLGLLMIDIDHFKAFNDAFGHPEGDRCLRSVADALKAILRRPGDVAARYGGEEFTIILPNTDSSGAAVMASRASDAVRALFIPQSFEKETFVTISVGVASCIPKLTGGVSHDLLLRADAALYEAKHAGRNQVRLAIE
jgi:diguanylate cyclase (GGDEF)-like protein/PAS domain S-box-containing protein